MVKCAKCGSELTEAKNITEQEMMPCPICGSLGRALEKKLENGVKVEDRDRQKLRGGKKTSSGRPGRELVQGHDYHRQSGVWNYLYRLIDRMKDWYHEKVTDLKTGKTIHECQEPLSKHRGRGSAKQSTKEMK
jgi:DNA-directed RNA polymerase subunit RPC12/RpoP